MVLLVKAGPVQRVGSNVYEAAALIKAVEKIWGLAGSLDKKPYALVQKKLPPFLRKGGSFEKYR